MSVQLHLSKVSSSLVLSASEKVSVNLSTTTLSRRLDGCFGENITEHFRFGSCDRGTILPRSTDPKSDVDYMIVFDNSGNYQPQTYLDRLRRFVGYKYSTSEVKQSHPTIVLSLNHIHFELVPAVRFGTLPNGSLQIPSPPSNFSSWMTTYPHLANRDVNEHNKANFNLSKPLIRLLKYWNCQFHTRPFSSFALEGYVVGLTFYGCCNIKDYFLYAVENLPIGYDKSQLSKGRIQRLKDIVARTKKYELDSMPVHAEIEIKKAIPEFS